MQVPADETRQQLATSAATQTSNEVGTAKEWHTLVLTIMPATSAKFGPFAGNDFTISS